LLAAARDIAEDPVDLGNGSEGAVSRPDYGFSGDNIEKDFWSDADWFRVNYCGGCVGIQGQRQGFGEPASWPTCQTTPEICAFFGPGVPSMTRKSKNDNFAVLNFSFSGTVDVDMWLANPTENCTWAQVVWTDCGAGGTHLLHQTLQPRTAQGSISTNNSKSWTRAYQTTNPDDNVGFKLDLF
jgi:hypothetical protein